MPAFSPQFEPVALPDQVVKLLPDGTLREVQAVEPMDDIGPLDFGSIPAGGSIGPANGSPANGGTQVSALKMESNHLGQYRMYPLSAVEVGVNQTGRQEQRFTNASRVGKATPMTPSNETELFVYESGVPFLIIDNPNGYDLNHSQIKFRGFKLVLRPGTLNESQLNGRQPIGVPTSALKVQAQQRQPPTQQQATQGSAVQPRGDD